MMPEGFFKDISKAFDRVWWHDERICKIWCCSIKGKPMKLIQSFLKKRYQSSLFLEEISACAVVHMYYVMDHAIVCNP